MSTRPSAILPASLVIALIGAGCPHTYGIKSLDDEEAMSPQELCLSDCMEYAAAEGLSGCTTCEFIELADWSASGYVGMAVPWLAAIVGGGSMQYDSGYECVIAPIEDGDGLCSCDYTRSQCLADVEQLLASGSISQAFADEAFEQCLDNAAVCACTVDWEWTPQECVDWVQEGSSPLTDAT